MFPTVPENALGRATAAAEPATATIVPVAAAEQLATAEPATPHAGLEGQPVRIAATAGKYAREVSAKPNVFPTVPGNALGRATAAAEPATATIVPVAAAEQLATAEPATPHAGLEGQPVRTVLAVERFAGKTSASPLALVS